MPTGHLASFALPVARRLSRRRCEVILIFVERLVRFERLVLRRLIIIRHRRLLLPLCAAR